MSLINVTDLSFTYDGSYDAVFDHVSFRLDTDWRLGFIGRNGRGKTTFLKLLCGEYAYGGRISASVDFEYFPYEAADRSRPTAAVLEAVCPGLAPWRLARELAALDVPEEALGRPFDTLSNGEQTKAMLAVLFSRENSFLLIDEPTNHLDMAARQSVSRYLRGKDGFILVSHDRAFLDGCIDHVLSINRANIEVQAGNFSSWLENKRRQDDFERAQNERLKKEVKRLEQTAREKAAWSDRAEAAKYDTKNSGLRPDRGFVGHKAAKTMKRAKTIEARSGAAARERASLLKNVDEADSLKLRQLPYHSARLLELDGVTISYGEKTACRGVSFTLEQGDRAALLGRNGSGKTSILKLVCGEPPAYTGRFQKGSGLIISLVPQDTSSLSGSLSAFAERGGADESLFKAILRKLGFERAQFDRDLRELSDGQKKKALIARSLCQQAHLHVWDEPLNYIDVISRMQLEELIAQFRPTLLFVEHDRAFCENVATKLIRLP